MSWRKRYKLKRKTRCEKSIDDTCRYTRDAVFIVGLAIIASLLYRATISHRNEIKIKRIAGKVCDIQLSGVHSLAFEENFFLNLDPYNCSSQPINSKAEANNLTSLPPYCTSQSKVHGIGMFATRDLPCLTVIGLGITNVHAYGVIDYKITDVGRKINHCERANIFLMEWTKAFLSLPSHLWAKQQRAATITTGRPEGEFRVANQSQANSGSEYLIVTQMPVKKGEELYLDYNSLPWFIYPRMPWYKKCDENF